MSSRLVTAIIEIGSVTTSIPVELGGYADVSASLWEQAVWVATFGTGYPRVIGGLVEGPPHRKPGLRWDDHIEYSWPAWRFR